MVIYNSATPGKAITKYTSIIDLLPTLLNMFNMDYDPRLYLGTDIFSNNHGRTVFADGSWQDDKDTSVLQKETLFQKIAKILTHLKNY